LPGEVITRTSVPELVAALNNQPVAPDSISNTVSSESDTRIIRILLPLTALNGATDNAYGMPFTYVIPLVYKEDNRDEALRKNPLQKITADVYTRKQFSAACSGVPFSLLLDSNESELALLTLETPNPYVLGSACINRAFAMKVCSAGFTGGWYNDSGLSDEVSSSAGYTYTPQAIESKDFYIKAKLASTEYGKIMLTVKTPPAQLYWKSIAADSDWNNPANWGVGSETGNNPSGFLPALCTEIQLPGNSSFYPSLTDSAGCGLINFKHGAVLGRQDLLHYDSAKVELTINGNRWYMFSPPLRNLYPGDFYASDPNPVKDGYLIEPMLFNAINPQTGINSAKWTGRFNNPDIELGLGRGIAVWVNDTDAGYDEHYPVSFYFPKSDPFYYFYDPYGLQLNERTPDLVRTYKGRFIYESSINSEGIVSWTIPDAAVDKPVLIGNPFLSHLDFEKFADRNSGLIKPEYKLACGVAASDGKVRDFISRFKKDGTYINSEGDSILTSYIPPMQAFVVVSKVSAPLTLKADIRETAVSEGSAKLRSAGGNSLPDRSLLISALRGEEAGRVLLLHRDGASNNYVSSEDSYKLFSESDSSSVMAYTRSSDGYALDINSFGDFGAGIPVGIRTGKPGEIRLQFSGMDSFDAGTGIYLHDMLTGESVSLSEADEYVFEKYDSNLYMDRFYLTFSSLTDMQGRAAISKILLQRLAPQTVRIASDNGSPLGRVQIIDIRGRVLVLQEAGESSYTFRASAPGVYIVRITGKAGTVVKKVKI
jgi:hypothetical protein